MNALDTTIVGATVAAAVGLGTVVNVAVAVAGTSVAVGAGVSVDTTVSVAVASAVGWGTGVSVATIASNADTVGEMLSPADITRVAAGVTSKVGAASVGVVTWPEKTTLTCTVGVAGLAELESKPIPKRTNAIPSPTTTTSPISPNTQRIGRRSAGLRAPPGGGFRRGVGLAAAATRGVDVLEVGCLLGLNCVEEARRIGTAVSGHTIGFGSSTVTNGRIGLVRGPTGSDSAGVDESVLEAGVPLLSCATDLGAAALDSAGLSFAGSWKGLNPPVWEIFVFEGISLGFSGRVADRLLPIAGRTISSAPQMGHSMSSFVT